MIKVAPNIAPGHGTRAHFIGLLIPSAGESGEAPAAVAALACKHSSEGMGRGFLERNASPPCCAFLPQPLLAPAARVSCWGWAKALNFGPKRQGERALQLYQPPISISSGAGGRAGSGDGSAVKPAPTSVAT